CSLQDPVVISVELVGINAHNDGFQGLVIAPWAAHLAETARIPQPVAAAPPDLDALLAEEDVRSARRNVDDAEAQPVCPKLVDEVERIRGVPQALGHLAALLVADQAVHIDVLEGDAARNLLVAERFPGSRTQ